MSADINADGSGREDPFRGEFYSELYIEELQERAETVHNHIVDAIRHVVEVIAWESRGIPELEEAIIPLFWLWEDIKLPWIAEAFSYDMHQVCEIAEARPLADFPCLDCGVQLQVRSRPHLTHLKRSLEAVCRGAIKDHLYDLLCDTCIEQRVAHEREQRQLASQMYLARLDALRRMPYANRRETMEWQVLRNQMLRRAGYRCQLCSASGVRLNVHHNTYDNYGEERLEDLVVLCRPCHERHHGLADAS